MLADTEFVSLPDTKLVISTDDGASYASSMDYGAWAPTLATVDLTELEDGWHAVQVRSVDDEGNADPSPVALGVVVGEDRWAPDTTVSVEVADVYVGSVVEVVATANEANCTFEYSMDADVSWLAMAADGVLEVTAEDLGSFHVFVRATDAAGNVDPAPGAAS